MTPPLCKVCGEKLETEKEKERGICDKDLHRGYEKLTEVWSRMKEEHG